MKKPSDPSLSRRHLMLFSIYAAGVSLAMPGVAGAAGLVAKDPKSGVAIKGYDTTAYFQKSEPKVGAPDTTVDWNGATWQFETAAEARLFSQTPEAFAPQFGGFCTRAMSMRIKVPSDPEVWRLHKGKLYLFARPVGGTYFDKTPDAMIAAAQNFWDTLT